DAVAQVRDPRPCAMVAAVPPHLREQGMADASRVELGDEIDGRLEAGSLALIGQRLRTEVLVDVPHPAPFLLGRGREQPRAAVAETECRQPALRDEAVGVRDGRRVAFEHEGAGGSTADSQSVDTLLQALETDRV